MKFKDLYNRDLNRKVNPAVSASDLDEETVKIEINEYVFTNEIINNLYHILTNIRENQGSHTGIWINGYYGSGKSHFLKFLDYCLSKKYGTEALHRLREAVAERKPLELDVELGELNDLIRWYTDKAQVETVMFNVGTVHDANSGEDEVFTQVFWNQFNGMRGFNDEHLAMAQYLEKALADDGKYQAFLRYVKEQGYDWQRNIHRFSGSKLDLALDMAAKVDPSLSIDVIRERIKSNDVNISVDSFASELKEYIDKKSDPNYRMVFLVDEISQFIDQRKNVLLQLQEIVTRVCEVCQSQVWFACTAQQDLSEVIDACKILQASEDYGKIMGRFEVRPSLQGTNPEYITQKRILDKKGEAEIFLEEMYKKDKAKLDAQFILPTTYSSYKDAKDFADYYPFVPYQFRLIMKVLDSFVNLDYVDRQVKGNERSLINITFSIAKETAEHDVGEFIPFDSFFGAMFQGSMQHLGQRALANARQALEQVEESKRPFYRRVVYVLFMICNLSDEDKQQFSATIDNIVTLLMTKMDASKAAIKSDVSEVIDFLKEKAVIRDRQTANGNEVFEFYTEEESKVAQLIKNQPVDNNTYCEELKELFFRYFGGLSNKENFGTRSFKVGASVDGRNYLSNNADVNVCFITSTSEDRESPYQYALTNEAKNLVFFMSPQLKNDKELNSKFLEYCRIQKFYGDSSNAVSEERQRVKDIFSQRGKELYENDIKQKFQTILDTCPVISGQNVLSPAETGSFRQKKRYEHLIQFHLQHFYSQGKLVDVPETPKTNIDLAAKIRRPMEPQLLETPLSQPEQKIKAYLERSPHDNTVEDVILRFAKEPYGWADTATVYYLNELIRRHLYAFSYNNNPDVSREEVAQKIIHEPTHFTIEPAKAIPQETLNKFIESWKHIFNVMTVVGSNDSTELYQRCHDQDNSALNQYLHNYGKLSRLLGKHPFTNVVEKTVDLLEQWAVIREHKKFFETIIDARESAGQLMDQCKTISTFFHDQYETYTDIINFIDLNHDNFDFLDQNRDKFPFLSPDFQKTVKCLNRIKEDEHPWESLQSYVKMKRTLEAQIGKCKENLISDIKGKYDAVFNELEQYAKESGVSREAFAGRDVTISSKTNTENFYALKANADTSAFYEQQLQQINAAVPKPAPIPSKDETHEPFVPPKPIRKIVHLQTHTAKPMHTEEDVDRYLQSLKKQLMRFITGNNDIIVN
ncbi:BREX system P-loop protein BrxC [Prevotella cerevisiae]|uniref:BREX system P-loop protein BrxC n=1 Tax=Segatella cerevisiae TaxID=2053716 RepID=A0ABT1BUX7_9BACT|nr:BREX system P-loop protein BrxC [Segatella cerevisiae]MCO6024885.1 BREX system P-loop protein BrxC [Segatella cerevisiae]